MLQANGWTKKSTSNQSKTLIITLITTWTWYVCQSKNHCSVQQLKSLRLMIMTKLDAKQLWTTILTSSKNYLKIFKLHLLQSVKKTSKTSFIPPKNQFILLSGFLNNLKRVYCCHQNSLLLKSLSKHQINFMFKSLEVINHGYNKNTNPLSLHMEFGLKLIL